MTDNDRTHPFPNHRPFILSTESSLKSFGNITGGGNDSSNSFSITSQMDSTKSTANASSTTSTALMRQFPLFAQFQKYILQYVGMFLVDSPEKSLAFSRQQNSMTAAGDMTLSHHFPPHNSSFSSDTPHLEHSFNSGATFASDSFLELSVLNKRKHRNGGRNADESSFEESLSARSAQEQDSVMYLQHYKVKSQAMLWRSIQEVSSKSPGPRIILLLHTSSENIHGHLSKEPLLQKIRSLCGTKCFLGSLKMTDSVDVGRTHCAENRINLSLCWHETEHGATLRLVNPEGGCIPLEMHQSLDVWKAASFVVEYIFMRENVTWFRTTIVKIPTDGTFNPFATSEEANGSTNSRSPSLNHPSNATPTLNSSSSSLLYLAPKSIRVTSENLLLFAKQGHLFNSKHKGGNISIRIDESAISHTQRLSKRRRNQNIHLLVTPRQVNKFSLHPTDFLFASVDLNSLNVHCHCSEQTKSSIDTGVHSALYHRLPQFDAFLHFHYSTALVYPHAITSFGYPCGCIEEADEIYRHVCLARLANKYLEGSLMMELKDHGYLLALTHSAAQDMHNTWSFMYEEYEKYMTQRFNDERVMQSFNCYPIFVLDSVAGIVAEHLKEKWVHFLLMEPYQGEYMDFFIKELDRRQCGIMLFHEDFQDESNSTFRRYLEQRGWKMFQEKGQCGIYQSASFFEMQTIEHARNGAHESIRENVVHYEIALMLYHIDKKRLCVTAKSHLCPTMQVTREEFTSCSSTNAQQVSRVMKQFETQYNFAPLVDLITPIHVQQFETVNVLHESVKRKYLFFIVWDKSLSVGMEWIRGRALEEPFFEHFELMMRHIGM